MKRIFYRYSHLSWTRFVFVLGMLPLGVLVPVQAETGPTQAEVVVYGGTPAGVTAAVAVASNLPVKHDVSCAIKRPHSTSTQRFFEQIVSKLVGNQKLI